MTNEEIEEWDFELQLLDDDEDYTCEFCGEDQENNEVWSSYDSHNNYQWGDDYCRECAIQIIKNSMKQTEDNKLR